MIDSDRTILLRRRGYTEREAEFLCLAADAGGYFLRRHFRRFLGQKPGRSEVVLARKLSEKGHAKVAVGARGIELYDLSPRRFYRAIGSPESRNRRRRPPSAIRTRLLTLDYVLDHRDARFLFADAEKKEYLTEQRGIPPKALPANGGLFIDRFPLHIPRRLVPPRRLVSFCYVDPQLFSTRRLRSFLERQRRLWEELGEFRLVYITDRRWNPRQAERLFRAFRKRHWPIEKARQTTIQERLLQAFRTDHGIRAGRISYPRRSDFALIERAKAELSPARYDSLFATWALTSDQAVYDLVEPQPRRLWPKGELISQLIAESYSFLGH